MHPTWFRFCRIGITPLFVICAASALKAQAIRVGPNVAVTSGLDQRPPVEAHLAIHPTNPRHLLGAAMTSVVEDEWREMRSKMTCSSFVSRDDGQSWHKHEFPILGCLDPWVSITSDGQAVFTAFAASNGELMAYHSGDGGISWEEQPVSLGAGHDHPTSVADDSSPERSGWLYVVSSRVVYAEHGSRAYVVYVGRSRDGGQTFDPPVYIRPNNLRLKAEVPIVLSDGTLVVSYVEGDLDGRTPLLRRRAWEVRSTDGGYTFSIPNFVNDACGAPFRLSMLAADASSGPFHNRLYFACNLPGTSGVVLNHTQEGGDRWGDVVQVHSAPVDTAIRRKVMALAVNKAGVVGVAWVDARNVSSDDDCYDIYFAASLDGGETFLPEQRVSESTSCPGTEFDGVIGRIFAVSGGDYIGMVGDADGRFRLLWSDARDGPFQLWTTWVEVDGEVGGSAWDGN